jgi:Bacterial PH domain
MAAFIDVVLVGLALIVSDATAFDQVAFLLLAVVSTYAIHRLANVHAVATREGLRVVNYRQRRQLEWSEIVGVRLAPGDPWVQLDVSDGGTVAVMAIQTADGDRGRAMALELATAVATYDPPDPSADA